MKVIKADKGKSLSSRYLQTNNMYCFHINSSDPYDETQLFVSAPTILYRFYIYAIDRPYTTVGQVCVLNLFCHKLCHHNISEVEGR